MYVVLFCDKKEVVSVILNDIRKEKGFILWYFFLGYLVYLM